MTPTIPTPPSERPPVTGFEPRSLDDDPVLMEQSFRLRYQVYCVERRFLSADDYPDQLERDEFDVDSLHVGVVDSRGDLAATARLVKPNGAGLPLFGHCTLFPEVTTFAEPGNVVVEVSRVSISRSYSRRRDDPPLSGAEPAAAVAPAVVPRDSRRRRHYEPFLTLLEATITGAKRFGATHLIGATDAALHRWLVHLGFPYRLSGPEVDYYGRVAPYIMSLAELNGIILRREFATLHDFSAMPEIAPAADSA
jgi:N-acyl amino acid synthase of PEP-CTERM/exosortase system